MRLIDAKAEESQVKTAFKYNPVIMGQFLRWIRMQDTVAAVPVSELLSLRDNLYEDDLITMRGLRDLNMLIAKYEGGTEKCGAARMVIVGPYDFCSCGERKENDDA